MFILQMRKKSTKVSWCACHGEIFLGHTTEFYKKFINFGCVTKSYRITFGAAKPNSINAKEYVDIKNKI